MKRKFTAILCAILTIAMLLPMMVSCGGDTETDSTASTSTAENEKTEGTESSDNISAESGDSPDASESASDANGSESGNGESQTSSAESGDSSESASSESTDTASADTEDKEENGGDEGNDPTVNNPSFNDIDNAAAIKYAESILNGVNYYYPNYKRETAVIENMEMSLEYGLLTDGNKQVTALKNKKGVSYVENTMDIFVRMTEGETYYASATKVSTTSNLFRLGYYFYEARYEGQNFLNSAPVTSVTKIDLSQGLSSSNDVSLLSNENGELTVQLNDDGVGTGFDPLIVIADGKHKGKFTLIEITMKADSNISAGQFYMITGSQSGFNSDQRYKFELIADGQYHTYTVPLSYINGYNGKINGLRFDVDGKNGGIYSIKEVNLVTADIDTLPVGLSIARSFNVYSNKMHHTLQVSAEIETAGIAEIGMLTKIKADTVEKLIVKDKSEELHTSLDGVDWATVEYIGFDIKGAGIFGYILPYDGKGGSIKVTLSDNVYHIEQVGTPKDGKISPSVAGTNNGNDFYLGQRIYTDDNHDFEEFLHEAFCERNPLRFGISSAESDQGKFAGYDSLRGIYNFTYDGSMAGPNDYLTVRFNTRGDDVDRKIYVMVSSPKTTVVEWSGLLNENDLLLPIPVEVGKNFSEKSGERNLYNIDDAVYSEAIVPLVIEKGQLYRYKMVNVYRKWGNFPVKQVSWIQFYAPYYHLSTGVTETNCITPYYATRVSRNLSMLPDFRAMSAPAFEGDQKNSGGTHNLLKYTDADGNFVTSENTKNTVGSYGPTYADVTMDFISDDGKIKVTYNHMEMPQEDENRTYYEMNYEILEDVSFKDFAKDFSFYSVKSNDPTGVYQLVGYLGEDGKSEVVNAKLAGDEAVYYTLGQNAPYFSYMKMTEDRGNKSGYVNLAFLVANSKFVIEGKEVTPNFVLADLGGTLSLSLDLGKITLKKGDKITINAILLPWGSQETIYDRSNGLAPDQNVLDVRENSIIKPLLATPVVDCEVIDSVFVPMLKTTNGKSAEFTLSGGHDNCAVRIYGFTSMTAPKIYEKVDGKWVNYNVASAYYSYNHETSQKYDGYGINYDGDGTFSYSFIAEMVNGAPRTFKIVADGAFKSWPEIDPSEVKSNAVQDEKINLIVKGENLFNASDSSTGFGSIEYLKEENAVRFYADPDKDASYFTVFQSNIFETGDYMVMRYRSTNCPATFKIYTSTSQPGETYENHHWSSGTLIKDGEWHVLVIDISEYEKLKEISFANENPPREYINTFAPSEEDGKFYATFLRIDLFNQTLSEGTYIDVQYIGFANDLENIKEYNNDLYYIQLSQTKTAPYYENILTGGGTPPSEGGNGGEDDNENTTTTTEPEPIETEMNIVFGGQELYDLTQTDQGAVVGISKIEYKDGYTRFYSDNTVANGSFNVFTGNTAESGKYLVIKYRLPSNNPTTVSTLKFNVSTTSSGVDVTNLYYATAVFKSDDNWQLLVLDLEKLEEQRESTNQFLPDETDGKYYPKFLKLTLFTDKAYGESTYIDIEYVGMCNSLGTIKVCNKDMGNIQFVDKNSGASPFYTNVINEYRYLDPTSEYTLADKYFCFHVDTINGSQTDANGNKYAYNSVSNKGITEKALNETLSETKLSVGGWCPVEGGIDKYMWSVDGKTWYECGGTFSDRTSVLSAASDQMGGAYTFTEATGDSKNSGYSLSIDLSEYAGQTVDVRIAAIPEGSTDTICVLTVISGVTVASATN